MPLLALDHLRDDQADQTDITQIINIGEHFHFFDGLLVERVLAGDTGHVDQNIDLLEIRRRLAGQILEVFKFADIGGDADRINAVFSLISFTVASSGPCVRGQNQVDAVLGQAKRDRFTNTAARSGYDRVFSLLLPAVSLFPCILVFYR